MKQKTAFAKNDSGGGTPAAFASIDIPDVKKPLSSIDEVLQEQQTRQMWKCKCGAGPSENKNAFCRPVKA